METKWLKEALFFGMTATAFKLGTVLTGGWFWVRLTGCTLLYRGSSMEQINFDDILAVEQIDAQQISPPDYVTHQSGMTYYYVVRRANNCGDQEHTLSAGVKVSIGADGELAAAQPNNIFEVKAEQVAGNKIQLVWYYCPIDQKSQPVCFNLYGDDGAGQIDYENPVATVSYAGRIFYNFRSDTLTPDTHLFAIRAQDAMGIENLSLKQIRIQLNTISPDAIEILDAEAI